MPRNRFRVPAKQWCKWSLHARNVFNDVHAAMADQSIYLHPKTATVPRAQWKTTAWNAAWTAASAVDDHA